MATYSITPARDEVIDFAGPYYSSQQAILVLADNDYVAGLEDLAGLIVATQAGSTGPAILEEYAPEATVDEYGTDQEARSALELGYVDAYVTDYTLLLNAMSKNAGTYKIVGDVFGPLDNYGIGVPEGSDAVDFINDFLNIIIEDGTWEALWHVSIGDRTGVADAPAAPKAGAADDEEAAAGYADGTYEAAYNGIGGKVPVTVTIEGGKIAAVEVGDNAETQGIGSKAIEQLPELIVAANGTDGVDGVSGASVTSQAIFKGVEDALAQASA